MAVGSPALSAWSEVDWDDTSTCLDLQHDTESQGYDTDDSWDFLDKSTHKPHSITIATPVSDTSTSQCEHWTSRKCHLTATQRKCCACVDTRLKSENGVYKTYVDGRAYVYEASRHQYYCPSCSVHPVETFGAADRRTESTVPGAIIPQPKPLKSTIARQTMQPPKETSAPPSKKLHAQREAAAKVAHQLQQMARGLLFQRTRCKHWVERNCELRATEGKCCNCIDKRPADTDYTVYIDGMGRLSGAEKYRNYCAGCKLAFEALEGTAVSAGMPMDLDKFKWREFKRKKKQAIKAQKGPTTVATATQEKEETQKMMTRQDRIAELKTSGAHANGGCIHWQGFGCKLKGPRCCACMDNRTQANRYIKYVDGEGDVMLAKRWEYYCPQCRHAGDIMEEKGINDRSYIAMLSMGRVQAPELLGHVYGF